MIDFAEARRTTTWQQGYYLLPRVINTMGLKVGAEIGVALGGHSDAILRQCPQVTTLYGIDCYRNRPDYLDLMNLPQADLDAMHADMLEFMKPHAGRFCFSRMTSRDAALCFSDMDLKLDFVYIDAEHSYEAASADIVSWGKHVRAGGIISGHDYGGFEGVTRAVNEYVIVRDYELHTDVEFFWWMVKR